MPRVRGTAGAIALIVMGVAAGLLLGEGALRLFQPVEFRVKGERIILPVNREYVIRNNGRWPKLDPVIVHRKNALGFRGANPPEEFEQWLTLITVGGSTTESFFLSDGKTWTDALRRLLARSFRRVWVNNAGLDGQSTYGHRILLEDYLVRLHPKVVLFLVGHNDVGVDQPQMVDQRYLRGGLRFTSFREFAISLAEYSEVAALAVNVYRVSRAGAVAETYPGRLDLQAVKRADTPLPERVARRALHRQRYLPGYGARLQDLIRTARDHGIEPVLVTQPALFGPGIDDVTGVDLSRITRHGMDGALAWEILELYNDVVRRVGIETGVAVLDLARALPRSSRYYYDFVHFTNEGAAEVGRILYVELCPFLAARFPSDVTKACGTGRP